MPLWQLSLSILAAHLKILNSGQLLGVRVLPLLSPLLIKYGQSDSVLGLFAVL